MTEGLYYKNELGKGDCPRIVRIEAAAYITTLEARVAELEGKLVAVEKYASRSSADRWREDFLRETRLLQELADAVQSYLYAWWDMAPTSGPQIAAGRKLGDQLAAIKSKMVYVPEEARDA